MFNYNTNYSIIVSLIPENSPSAFYKLKNKIKILKAKLIVVVVEGWQGKSAVITLQPSFYSFTNCNSISVSCPITHLEKITLRHSCQPPTSSNIEN